MNYASKEGGDFAINISVPLNVDDIPIRGVQPETTFPMSPISTFEGRAYIPGLPQVRFTIDMMYLEQAPTQPVVDDSKDPTTDDNNVLGSMHRDITVGENKLDGAYDQVGFGTQKLDEQGTMAMVVQPRFTYVGTRADNCS